MNSASFATTHRRASDPQRRVDEEIRHIRDLVFVRSLLAARGAPAAELGRYDAVIDEARVQLAESARLASAPYVAAA
jgi:hypothetical protein